ncbi:hypothetical protein Hanom_Chr03g00242871 [Helianthus anomalus]
MICVPFRGSFYNNKNDQFYCLILLRAYAVFQAFAASIIRGLGQNFHSSEVPG